MLFSGIAIPSTATPDTPNTSHDIKAGFIYVGPVGDYGWTNAHHVGQKIVEAKYDWLTTVSVESVAEDAVALKTAVDIMISEEQVDVIFTTSFGFMDGTLALATDYPDKIFFHASGFKRAPNMGTYFADFYQLYYLNGLMAGALTESNKLGYVGAFPIPEVVRHINAFALGAKEVNPDANLDVTWLNSWVDPSGAKNAANALIANGVDVLAFTEDTPAVLEATEDADGVYGFSHYSPMQIYAPLSTISGQLVHWEILYDEILVKVHDGVFTSTNLMDTDFLYFIYEDAVELGGAFGQIVNPVFESALEAVMVSDPTGGVDISVLELVNLRLTQMDKPYDEVTFDPFTGPISSQNGTLKLADGVRATIPELFAEMDWFVDNINGAAPDGGPGKPIATPIDPNSIAFAFIAIGVLAYVQRRKRK